MQAWQLEINCPLCGVKFSASRALKHKKKKHPDVEADKFIAEIKGALERGENVFDTKRVVTETRLAGKSVFSKDVRGSLKWFTIVPGGAVGLGKKK